MPALAQIAERGNARAVDAVCKRLRDANTDVRTDAVHAASGTNFIEPIRAFDCSSC